MSAAHDTGLPCPQELCSCAIRRGTALTSTELSLREEMLMDVYGVFLRQQVEYGVLHSQRSLE